MENERESFLHTPVEAHVPYRSLCVRATGEERDQAQYLREVCETPRGFRWTACATVGAAQLLHASGVDVPVSGSAGLAWLAGGAA